ncbi:hypothetical protein QWY85_09420 [Neolewinella lacunae]|uniref:Uncharacterized protein n=1 Tax=Neolewinella lacunae TaxID=1517758 RepID=A0A923PS94_9BACT|nr:hypothetical protein [Neolewinella lacunae]MBC6996559.1 hypothetical protein [Neolewinella lacunae]MDN3634877.1 hypothetical protein [Neolewinella lacunae]
MTWRRPCPLIPRHAHQAESYGETILWRSAEQAENQVSFHPAAPGEPGRGIAEIPLVELVALARNYITRGLDENELVRAMGNDINLSAVRGEPRKRILRAVEYAWASGA